MKVLSGTLRDRQFHPRLMERKLEEALATQICTLGCGGLSREQNPNCRTVVLRKIINNLDRILIKLIKLCSYNRNVFQRWRDSYFYSSVENLVPFSG